MGSKVSKELSDTVLEHARDLGEESADFEHPKTAFGAYECLSGSAAGYLSLQLIKQVIEKLPQGEGVFGISNYTVDVNHNGRWNNYRFTNAVGDSYKAIHRPPVQKRDIEMHQCFFYDVEEAIGYDFHFNSVVQSSVDIDPDGAISFHYGNDPSAFERLMDVSDFFRPLLQPLISDSVAAGGADYLKAAAKIDPVFEVIAADGGIPGERFRELVSGYLVERFEDLSRIVEERFEDVFARLQDGGLIWGERGLASPTEEIYCAVGGSDGDRRAIVIVPERDGGSIRMLGLERDGDTVTRIEVYRLPGDAAACEAAVSDYESGARIAGRLVSFDPTTKSLELADRDFTGMGEYQGVLLNSLESAVEAVRDAKSAAVLHENMFHSAAPGMRN
jgi:hypothetical protein